MGDTWIGDRDGIGLFGEFSEDGVDCAFTQRTEVADLHAMGALCIRHDRAVAAEFFERWGELDISTFASSGADACAKLSDRRYRRELVTWARTFIDGVHDLIDEAVDADEGVFRAGGGGVGSEFLER